MVVHEYDVRCFDGGVRTKSSHSDSHIGAGQHRCIVDAVAGKSNVAVISKECFDFRDFSCGKKSCTVFCDADFFSHTGSHLFVIAGEHDDPTYPGLGKGGKSPGRVFFQFVVDDDMTEILHFVFLRIRNTGEVHDGAREMAIFVRSADLFHEFSVSYIKGLSVDDGTDTVSGDLFHFT